MNYRRHILLTLLAVVVLAGVAPVQADPPVDSPDINSRPETKLDGPIPFARDQVVVGFDEREEGETALSSGLVHQMVASLDRTGIYLFQLAEGVNPIDAAEELIESGGATFAHPNYLLDELHPVQGSLAFPDQASSGDFDDQPAAQVLGLPAVHQVVTGNATVIAIIDGGIEFDHPGLDGQAYSGYDFIDNDDYAQDEPGGTASGHGTFVAGIAHLVAPNADLVAYRVMNANGQGDGFSLAQAIERASLEGCDVINISLVLTHQHLAVQAAIEQAVARGTAVVAAAGNDPTGDPVYPAAENGAISVAAIDTDFKATDFTNYGDYVDLCAPGFEVYSAYQDPYYAWWSGTSFATPFVAGQMSLLRERFAEAGVDQLREILTSSAQNVDDLNPHRAGGLGAGCIRPRMSLYDNCCDMPGDLDGDGIPFDMTDGAAMDTVFATGNPDYLGDCLGNGDLNGDCRIAADDLDLMHQAIIGDTMPYLDCAPCLSYTLDFYLPNEVNCCDDLGDLDGNGIAYELEDAAYLEYMLTNGDMGIRALCLGNADVTGDCRVDHEDLTYMIKVYAGNESPIPECGDCDTWVLIPGIPRPDTAWVTPYNQAFEIPAGMDSVAQGSVYVGSFGVPKAYSVEVKGDQVVTLLTSTGMTNGDFNFEVNVTPTMDSGLYVDTLVFDIDGVSNSPRISIVYLALGCCGGYATAQIYPYAQAFYAPPNMPHTQMGSVLVSSANAPADYRVEVWGSEFTQLLNTTGTTNDSLTFEITTGSGLEPGVYFDTLAFYIDGTSASPDLALLFLEVTGGGTTDTAWVTPYNQAFEVPAGIDSTSPGSVYVGSSGDPLPYSVEVKGDQVVTLLNSTGMTNSDFTFEVAVTPTMDSGLYIDTLVFDIEGARNSSRISIVYLALGCCGGYATAQIYPYAQAFGAPPKTPHTQMGSVTVTSANAPADYRVEVWGSDFTQLLNPTGTTNDSLTFEITTGSGLEPGVYFDTLAFYIDGTTASPDLALLFLEVAVYDGLDSAIVHTSPGEFFMPEGESQTQTGNIVVTATGLPKNFTINYLDDPEFLTLMGNGGMTGEPTAFEVTSSAEMAPGVYVDSVISHVDSCGNSPVVTPIYLYIDSTGSGVVGDSAWVYALPGSFFNAPAGEDHSQPGSLVVGARGESKAFTIMHLNPGGFVHLERTDGFTNDSVAFDIISAAGMAPGVYVDSLIIDVEDVMNSPLLHTIYLNVAVDTLSGGDGSATVVPNALTFEATTGSTDTLSAYLGIHSSNQPATYTVYSIGGETSFISVPDSLGTTPDSVLIWIVPEGWHAGVYTDTIIVAVDGIIEQPRVVVTLEIGEAAAQVESLLNLANYPNPFNPSTEIVYSLPSEATVTLTVYNVLGREVITLLEDYMPAGEHRITWDGTNDSGVRVASGIYLYRLQAGAIATTKKMILLR